MFEDDAAGRRFRVQRAIWAGTDSSSRMREVTPVMGIGVSLLLIAGGAILAFAVGVEESNGFDTNGIGVILMIVGTIGLIASLMFWNSWGGYRGDPVRRRRIIEEEDI